MRDSHHALKTKPLPTKKMPSLTQLGLILSVSFIGAAVASGDIRLRYPSFPPAPTIAKVEQIQLDDGRTRTITHYSDGSQLHCETRGVRNKGICHRLY